MLQKNLYLSISNKIIMKNTLKKLFHIFILIYEKKIKYKKIKKINLLYYKHYDEDYRLVYKLRNISKINKKYLQLQGQIKHMTIQDIHKKYKKLFLKINKKVYELFLNIFSKAPGLNSHIDFLEYFKVIGTPIFRYSIDGTQTVPLFKRKKMKKRYSLKRKIFSRLRLRGVRQIIRGLVRKRLKSFERYRIKPHLFFFKKFLTNSIIYKKTLINLIPISSRIKNQQETEFFYKMYKSLKTRKYKNFTQKMFKIYYQNYHKKPYWTFRLARLEHWKFFSYSPIRKQKYKIFLKKYLKRPDKRIMSFNFLFSVFSQIKFSWTNLCRINFFLKTNLYFKKGLITKWPLFFSSFFNWKFFKKKEFLKKKKLGKWGYLSFKKHSCPWLQKKKNTPKTIKHIEPSFLAQFINNYDFFTSYSFIYNQEFFKVSPLYSFKNNLLIKLHMYRYKAN